MKFAQDKSGQKMSDLEYQTESFALRTRDEATSYKCSREHDKINYPTINPGSLIEIVAREDNE